MLSSRGYSGAIAIAYKAIVGAIPVSLYYFYYFMKVLFVFSRPFSIYT